MWKGTLPGTLAANELSGLIGDLAVQRLAVELGRAEGADALLAREALDEAHLDHAAGGDGRQRRVVDVERPHRGAGAADRRRGRRRLGARLDRPRQHVPVVGIVVDREALLALDVEHVDAEVGVRAGHRQDLRLDRAVGPRHQELLVVGIADDLGVVETAHAQRARGTVAGDQRREVGELRQLLAAVEVRSAAACRPAACGRARCRSPPAGNWDARPGRRVWTRRALR